MFTNARKLRNGEVTHEAMQAIYKIGQKVSVIPGLLERVINEEMWRDYQCWDDAEQQAVGPRVEYATLDAFITAPQPLGLGTTRAKLIEVLEMIVQCGWDERGIVPWCLQQLRTTA